MTTQSCLGTLQLTNELLSGIAAESVAYAEMGRATNNYNNNMTVEANNQLGYGQKMAETIAPLTIVQGILAGVMAIGFGAGFIYGAGLLASTGASTLVSGVMQASQGILSAVQGGLESYKSNVLAQVENASTSVSTFQKVSESDVNTIKAESQGAQKTGSSIWTMLNNEGAVGKQKN